MENKYNEAIKMLQSAREKNHPFTLVITDVEQDKDVLMLAAPIKATAYHVYNIRKTFKEITKMYPEQAITLDQAYKENQERKRKEVN